MAPEWYLYFLCGVKGIMDRFNLLEGERRTSMHVLLDGVIPANAGLSSSSAIVCSAAIATLTANKVLSFFLNKSVRVDSSQCFLFQMKPSVRER